MNELTQQEHTNMSSNIIKLTNIHGQPITIDPIEVTRLEHHQSRCKSGAWTDSTSITDKNGKAQTVSQTIGEIHEAAHVVGHEFEGIGIERKRPLATDRPASTYEKQPSQQSKTVNAILQRGRDALGIR
jgi:hypothetical protein